MRVFYIIGMLSTFLSNTQSSEAIKQVTDGSDLVKLRIFQIATNIINKVK